MAQKIAWDFFQSNTFQYKYAQIPNHNYTSYLLSYEDGRDRVFWDVDI
jgi:hypothetical protein